MGLLRAGIVASLAILALAPAAQAAAQRYASPAGSGAECTAASPCSLETALSSAKANDEVIVTPGTYAKKTGTLTVSGENVFVHGEFGAAAPLIKNEIFALQLYLAAPKVRIAHLELVNESNNAAGIYCKPEVTVEQVKITVKGSPSTALSMEEGCTVRDSVILAEGTGSFAISASAVSALKPGTVRNVTAIAAGPESAGLRVAGFTGPYSVNVRNSILTGATDLWTVKTTEGGGLADVAYSNFDTVKAEPGTTITQGAGNQTAASLFVNAAAGDYHQAAGSPTIDGGTAEGVLPGETDYDGNARFLGPAPDIGAFEAPPAAQAPVAGTILSLTIAPNAFKPANVGGAIISARKKRKAPVSTKVSYSVSAAATVVFSVERRLPGRKVGKRCVKPTKANRAKKRCSRFKPVKGSFTHTGQAGQNSFKFSGRIAGKALKPGRYRLVGKTGTVSKRASFRLVK